MAHWKNPEQRKINGKMFTLHTEGMTRTDADRAAKHLREKGMNARVVEDDRLGRYQKWCIYSRKR